jgi:glycosyltransferase involved in cell wall biosynthesis
MNIKVKLNILGDGILRDSLLQLVDRLGLNQHVTLHGSVSHERVRQFYRESDFVIQAPLAEGYGKVPHESFFHGVVPILSDVNLARQIVDNTNRGRWFPLGNPEAITQHVAELAHNTREMSRLIENGYAYARTLTLEAWQQHIKQMLELFWEVKL